MNSNFLKIILVLLLVFSIVGLVIIFSTDQENRAQPLTEELKQDLEILSDQIIALDSNEDLDYIIENTQERRYVLLGESSHGTSEYYQWRAQLSKRLIEENSFSYIAIEGDWPNIYQVNQYVKSMADAPETAQEALGLIDRWPQWMWNNEEFLELVEWVREYNDQLPFNERVGIYGMDMQDLDSATIKSKTLLNEINPNLKETIRDNFECLEEYNNDIQEYAEQYFSDQESCEEDIKNLYDAFRDTYSQNEIEDSQEIFELYQNILAIKYAEAYGRKLTIEGAESWNKRVTYMEQTVINLAAKYGENSKGIVWAHNTHLGDASATEMADVGMVNMGQLLRERYGKEDIFIVGFGTYTGQVMASFQWGNEPRVLDLPDAIEGSIESFLNDLEPESFIVPMHQGDSPEILTQRIGHRAKGVVYNPAGDQNHYVQTILSDRYDAFIFIKETSSLNPL